MFAQFEVLSSLESIMNAQLNICPICGKHANVSWSGGIGPEFGSKRHAAYILQEGILQGCVTSDEAHSIKRILETSSLPDSPKEGDAKILWGVEMYNLNRITTHDDQTQAHEFISTLATPPPPDFVEASEAELEEVLK